METIKVSSKSEPNKVAGALANVFREKGVVEVQAIGAGALNQAIKGVAIARGFVAPSGKNLVCTPAFIDINIDGEDVTSYYKKGAEIALKKALDNNVKKAILKENSPSCGSGFVYDGTFSHKKVLGDGLTAKLLKENGIKVYNENNFLEINK